MVVRTSEFEGQCRETMPRAGASRATGDATRDADFRNRRSIGSNDFAWSSNEESS
jgi:hypothetical protein